MIYLIGNYACLAIGYLEKVKLYQQLSLKYTAEEVWLILEAFLRYVYDGFMFWPAWLDINDFIQILKSLHPNIKFTVQRGIIKGTKEIIYFLDIKITLHDGRIIETELYYKETNNHHYLEYSSFHAKHVRDNVPYGFFKKIIVFTTDNHQFYKNCKR